MMGKERHAQGVEEGADVETAMDAELKAALEHDEDDDLDAEGNIDYNLIKNFLEKLQEPGWVIWAGQQFGWETTT